MVVFPIATALMFFMAFLMLISLIDFHLKKDDIIEMFVDQRLSTRLNQTDIDNLFNNINFNVTE